MDEPRELRGELRLADRLVVQIRLLQVVDVVLPHLPLRVLQKLLLLLASHFRVRHLLAPASEPLQGIEFLLLILQHAYGVRVAHKCLEII